MAYASLDQVYDGSVLYRQACYSTDRRHRTAYYSRISVYMHVEIVALHDHIVEFQEA